MKEHPNYWRAVKANQPFQQLDFFLLCCAKILEYTLYLFHNREKNGTTDGYITNLLYLHLCKQFILSLFQRLFKTKISK